MSSLHILDSTATGLHKKGTLNPESSEQKPSALIENTNEEANLSENAHEKRPDYVSDKKTDVQSEAPPPSSLLWRLGSGIYGTTTGAIGGAVGIGTGSVKWVAGKSYDATSAVVSTTVNTSKTIYSYVPPLKKKDKKE